MIKVIVKSMRSKKTTTQLDIHLKIEDDFEAIYCTKSYL